MRSELTTYALEDCLDALIDYRGKTPRKTGDGIPLITAKVVKRGRIESPNEFIAHEDFDAWMTRGLPNVGDVVMTTEAPLGEVGQILKLPVALAQRIVTLRGKKRILQNDYLLYALQSEPVQAQLRGRSSGTTVVGIKQSELRKVTLDLPPFNVQGEIAGVLKSLDDRIDLLRQTNVTLESIAQALFKSWFIDFDPVRAKAEGREPEGMDASTAALFPAEFEESTLGLIPQGWRVGMISDAVEINPSRTLSKGTEARYLEMANAPTTGHRPTERVGRRAFGSGCKFRNGDALLAKITPCLENGKGAFIDFLGEGEVGWGSTEFIVLRSKPVLPQFGAYLLTRHEPFRQFAIQAMTGTSGRQRVELSRLVQFSMALPPDVAIARAAESVLGSLQARIAAHDELAKTLADLRESLLPRLISGKLRIPEAEEQIEAALA
jgi:type I restriction enzyme S subunit